VEYPAKIMQIISEDTICVGFLANKGFAEVTEDDFEWALEKRIYDYQYVDETADEASAYVWVETEVNRVENSKIKDMRIYITVTCHKEFMKLNCKTFKGMIGNRRDNLSRYIDKLFNGKSIMGIGALRLKNVRSVAPATGFTGRELCYEIRDFNIVEEIE
jgi:hypothetical protein